MQSSHPYRRPPPRSLASHRGSTTVGTLIVADHTRNLSARERVKNGAAIAVVRPNEVNSLWLTSSRLKNVHYCDRRSTRSKPWSRRLSLRRPPRLLQGGAPVLGLLRPVGAGTHHCLRRAPAADQFPAHRQATAGRAAHALRLDGHRRGESSQSRAHHRDPRHPQKKGKTHSHFTHTGGDWAFLPPPNFTKEALHHGY